MYIPKYFKSYELVSKEVYDKYGEDSHLFLTDEIKKTLDDIREFFDLPITMNTWKWNGHLKSRGYRDPFTTVGGRLSQHRFGRAADFDVKGKTADEVREELILNKSKFPHIHRMEIGVSWVHIDSHPDYKDKRIYLFKP